MPEAHSIVLYKDAVTSAQTTYVLLELLHAEDLLVVPARWVPAEERDKVHQAARQEALVL